jgi:hypothetical protein
MRKQFKVQLKRQATVAEVKAQLATRDDVSVDAAHIKMVFEGKTCKDSETLQQCGIGRDSVVQVRAPLSLASGGSGGQARRQEGKKGERERDRG